MNRYPEISVLKWIAKEVLLPMLGLSVLVMLCIGLAHSFILAWRIAPSVYEALWPGWAFGLAAMYFVSVLVRMVR